MKLNSIAKLVCLLIAALLFWTVSLTSTQAWPKKFTQNGANQTKVTLYCPSEGKFEEGDTFEVALVFDIPEGSHIYGRSGGENGLLTTIKWKLPAGINIAEAIWPPTQQLKFLGENISGYEGQIAVIYRFLASSSWPQMPPICAEISWLDCNEKGCHPGQALLQTESAQFIHAQSEPYNQLIQQTLSRGTKESYAVALSSPKNNSTDIGSAPLKTIFAGRWLKVILYAAGAFLGGIILNFMPCVFPVLSLKVFSLVEQAQEAKQRGRSFKAAAWFSLGILLSFWAVAFVMIAFKAGGKELGWGFQMQYPAFVAGLTLLFFLIALNMWGVFEFGLSLTRLGGLEQNQPKAVSAIFSGVLTVVAATPCTAPFMGSALGFSFAEPFYISLIIFTFLALGMALPYAALASWPSFLRYLPRPGYWMETVKQFLAFPLAFACVYFIWVFAKQTSLNGAIALLIALIWASLAAWTYGRLALKKTKAAWILVCIISAICLFTVYWACTTAANVQPTHNSATDTYNGQDITTWSPQAVQKALSQGRSVFIDFGADWCLTCQVNEKTVLSNPEIKELFRERGIVFLKADWTKRNEEITEALRTYGRSGVPLYVYYEAHNQSEPVILPEILTVNIVKSYVK